MPTKTEVELCPKDKLPESAHRYSGGARQSVCGNGHSWPTGSVLDAQRNAQRAKDDEILRHASRYSYELEAAHRRKYGF